MKNLPKDLNQSAMEKRASHDFLSCAFTSRSDLTADSVQRSGSSVLLCAFTSVFPQGDQVTLNERL